MDWLLPFSVFLKKEKKAYERLKENRSSDKIKQDHLIKKSSRLTRINHWLTEEGNDQVGRKIKRPESFISGMVPFYLATGGSLLD
jgi:hypothetical protein